MSELPIVSPYTNCENCRHFRPDSGEYRAWCTFHQLTLWDVTPCENFQCVEGPE